MEVIITHANFTMINDIQAIADMTVGKGLVLSDEIISSVEAGLAFIIKDTFGNKIIGFSLNEILNLNILKSIYNRCNV